jgi:hypothetical protein
MGRKFINFLIYSSKSQLFISRKVAQTPSIQNINFNFFFAGFAAWRVAFQPI